MHMRSKTRLVWATGILVLMSGSLARAEQPTTQPKEDNVARLLKLADADVEALKKLDYSKVDLNTEDLATKTMAAMALNKLLATHGERARVRVTLLEDYIDKKGLADAFSQDSSVVPESPSRTFEDGLKIAVVLVKSPEGQTTYWKQVSGLKPETLQRVYHSYYALCEKNWGEVMYRRFRVQELASFLDSKGLINDFVSWTRDETARQKKERAEAVKQFQAEQKAEDEKARGKRMEKVEKERQREHEYLMRRLEYAYDSGYANGSRYYYYP